MQVDVRNASLIPGWGRSAGGEHDNTLQYSCLENPMEEEPGRLQSMGSHIVGHDWSNLALGFPGGRVVKNLPAHAGDSGDRSLILGLGRPPGVGIGNLLQYSCLGNPMDRGAWWSTVHGGCKVSDTTEHSWMHYACPWGLLERVNEIISLMPLAQGQAIIIVLF